MSDTITVQELSRQIQGEQGPRVVDVREDGDEFNDGHIPGAQHIPLSRIEASPGFVGDDRPVVMYGDGNEGEEHENASSRAAALLRERGVQVIMLQGGLEAWRAAGLPMEYAESKRDV